MKNLSFIFLLMSVGLSVQGAEPAPELFLWSLPQWVGDSLSSGHLGPSRRPCACLNPYYQRADFDGDGHADYAVLIHETSSSKVGIAIVFYKNHHVELLGAGRPKPDGRDDFAWMDAWQVYDRGPVEQGVGEGKPPTLRGDALLVEKTEAASALLWWNGKEFLWYQQGD